MMIRLRFPGQAMLRGLTVCAVLTALTAAVPAAFGQNLPLHVPGEMLAEPPGPAVVPSDGTVPGPMIGGEPHVPDYWIVSSRRGRQSGAPALPAGQLDYFHVGGDWQMRGANEAAFRSWLVPGAPVCIIVHGTFVDWPGLVQESGPIFQWVRAAAPDRPLQVVFLTWPSESVAFGLPHVDVGILSKRASFNGTYLAHLVDRIPPECPVTFLAHSFGARVVASGLHLMAGGDVAGLRAWGGPDPRRMRAVFFAAALDRHWLAPGERYGMALCRLEGLLNLRNGDDLPLAFYPLRRPFSHRSLGREGFKARSVRRMGMQAAKIAELDVASLIGSGHFWQHYYRRPEIAAAIVDWLYYSDAPVHAAPPLELPPAPVAPHFR